MSAAATQDLALTPAPARTVIDLDLMTTPPPSRLIITIDGPAGTGKSTTARELAARLGLEMLNTGAMYRAATALALDAGLRLGDVKDPEVIAGIAALTQGADLHFDWSKKPPVLLVSGKPMTDRLLEPDVRKHVSMVSSIPVLRRHMERKQRLIAQQHPLLVTEGRDQGSIVFPDADVKFYLEASVEERAKRRAHDLRHRGEQVDLAALERDISERDHFDSTRPDSPLVCPPDAVRVKTDHLSLNEVVARLEQIVKVRTGAGPVRKGGH